MRKAFCKNVENVGKMSSILAVNEEKRTYKYACFHGDEK